MWIAAINTVRVQTGYPTQSYALNEAHTKGVSVESPSPAQSQTLWRMDWGGNQWGACLKPECLDKPRCMSVLQTPIGNVRRNRRANKHKMLHVVRTVIPAIWNLSTFRCSLYPGKRIWGGGFPNISRTWTCHRKYGFKSMFLVPTTGDGIYALFRIIYTSTEWSRTNHDSAPEVMMDHE